MLKLLIAFVVIILYALVENKSVSIEFAKDFRRLKLLFAKDFNRLLRSI